MTSRLHYGRTAKVFHWLIVAILLVQYPLGWLMPDVRRGEVPGMATNAHISIGIVVMGLIVLRLAWRLTHPVAPESNLPPWQRLSSEAVHWLLYLAVFLTAITGWIYASMRGWALSFFVLFPLPPLVAPGSPMGRQLGELHGSLIYVLIGLICLHVLAALVHMFVYRDGVMRRMLPGNCLRTM